MSGDGAWGEARASNGSFGSRRFFYIPPHLRHNFSPAPAVESINVASGAWNMNHRAPRQRRERRRDSRERNPFGIVGDEMRDLRISDSVDGAGNGIDFSSYEDIPVETSGSDVPPPASTFAEIDLGDALNRNIRRCRYVKPTPVQRYAIPISLAGRDLMACAQTGSGKTAAFCFPIISGIMRSSSTLTNDRSRGGWVACPVALILSPTRELSCQIHDEAKKFSYQTGVRVCVVYGGAPAFVQLRNLEKGVDILVATPGRLMDLIERDRISLQKVNYLVLDEADRMLDMGFEPQIRKLVEQMDMPPPGTRQTMLFSATFPHGIQTLYRIGYARKGFQPLQYMATEINLYDLNSSKLERSAVKVHKWKEYEKLRRRCLILSNYRYQRSTSVTTVKMYNEVHHNLIEDPWSEDYTVKLPLSVKWSGNEGRPVYDRTPDSSPGNLDTGKDEEDYRRTTYLDAFLPENNSSDSEFSGEVLESVEVPDRKPMSSTFLSANAPNWNVEDFRTSQRIIRLDALRADAEWVIYSSSQASISEELAHHYAKAVGLKDFDRLEPCNRVSDNPVQGCTHLQAP